jgi:hypothetical protein
VAAQQLQNDELGEGVDAITRSAGQEFAQEDVDQPYNIAAGVAAWVVTPLMERTR